ncbi:flagellar motor protein MotB [Paenibacillus selenitireducens]|uniref:Flagellar motor protein MotB n=1 Tax=Paenibacillus selenitireducens TaxID=1324314 RepID=A0A1T2X0V0_9BACL|nr:flagellar motor protein MotB [Paenibacillus selenitireducens]OPA73500.1 flagellar motor protein MotB [Paenibacillus selenitireducens]
MSKKNRKVHHDDHIDESWLIPYADIMTLLLALFIVLYSMSAVDAKKFEEMSQAFSMAFNGSTGILDQTAVINTGPDNGKKDKDKANMGNLDKKDKENMAAMKKEEENMEKIKKQLDQYIKDNKLTNQLNTKLNQSQLLITISDTALFSSGSATVKPESRSLAVALSDMLVQFPGYEVIITGHTDNQPISNSEFESNWELSSTRASKFMKILLQNQSLDPKLFSVIGQGEYRPIASNNTNIGRAQNRRVEISIMRKFVDNGADQKITVKK